MGGHPLVSGIWQRSRCLWPRSNFLQARTQVSTNKGGVGVGEALTSTEGETYRALAPSWECDSGSSIGEVSKLGLSP